MSRKNRRGSGKIQAKSRIEDKILNHIKATSRPKQGTNTVRFPRRVKPEERVSEFIKKKLHVEPARG